MADLDVRVWFDAANALAADILTETMFKNRYVTDIFRFSQQIELRHWKPAHISRLGRKIEEAKNSAVVNDT